MSTSIFNDSWYKVSELRVSLLPSVIVQEQIFRTKIWYVLKDDCNESFFRVAAETYRFIKALNPNQSVQDIWEAYVERYPAEAPSREEVVALLTQLHASNLLYFRNDANAKEISRRIGEARRNAWVSNLTSFLFFRVPLWNPDAALRWVNARIPNLLVRAFGLLWLVVVGWGAWIVAERIDVISDKTQGILASSNLIWLFICTALMKLLHEACHGLVCKRFGGRVRSFGVMFLIFTPLPYVDVTSAWGFPNRWHRIAVGLAGMYIELFVAALGALVWANTGAGLVNSICFNLMFVGSVSSIVFNGNPLLRFDAYYILSDFVGIPNLYAKAEKQCLDFGKKFFFGLKDVQLDQGDRREKQILYLYGVLSYGYLLMVTYFVTVMLLDQWFIIGVVTLLSAVYAKLLHPIWNLIRFTHSAAVRFNPRRALLVSYGIPVLLVLFAVAIPLPSFLLAPGVLESRQFEVTYAQSEGRLRAVLKHSGEWVRQGEVIAVLENPEIDARIRINRDEWMANEVLMQNMLYQSQTDLEPVRQRGIALTNELKDLKLRREQLTVRAHFDGWWFSPVLQQNLSGWIYRGEVLGQLVDTRSFRFTGVISQEQAEEIFASKIDVGEVALYGQSDHRLALRDIQVLPAESTRLASAALGWMGGGDVPVRTDENSGTQAREPFYILRGNLPADLPQGAATWVPMHGLSGKLKLHLQAQTGWTQLSLFLRQLVQKRYSL